MRGAALVCCVVAALLIISANAADEEKSEFRSKLEKCFHDDWLKGFVPCFTGKLSNLIDYIKNKIPGNGYEHGPQRRLQSLTPFSTNFLPKSAKPRQTNKYHHFMRTMQELNGELEAAILDQLKSLPRRSTQDQANQNLVRVLARLDYTAASSVYNNQVITSLMDLYVHMQQHGTESELYNSFDLYETSPYQVASEYGIKAMLEKILSIVEPACSIVPESGQSECRELTRILTCMTALDEADFEDNLKWTRCVYQCQDLPELSQCMVDQFNQDTLVDKDGNKCELPWPIKDISWVAPVLIKALTTFVKLDHCYFNVELADNTTEGELGLRLREGQSSVPLQLRVYVPPAVHCVHFHDINTPLGLAKGLAEFLGRKIGKCPVSIQIVTQTYLDDIAAAAHYQVLGQSVFGPFAHTCIDGSLRRMAVLGWHDLATEELGSGVITLTDSNWNQDITIPVAPTIDSKPSGGIEGGSLTIRMKAGNRFIHQHRVPLNITDEDVDEKGETSCFALAYGQIINFNQVAYNNLYYGHFKLYQHQTLPYEVQVVYQSCNGTSTQACNCAVAVRIGSDVFVVDKCRRKNTHDQGDIVRTLLYQNGNLTPNLKVFRTHDGLRYQILLPIGTYVTITVRADSLNAHIRPSAADDGATHGLCSIETSDKLPRDLIKSLRVAPASQIVQGALSGCVSSEEQAEQDTRYCTCSHTIFKGATCHCGHPYLLETCDLHMDGDFTERLPEISMPSLKEYAANTGEHVLDELDVDDSFEPEDPSWSSELKENDAEKECKRLLKLDPMVKLCAKNWPSNLKLKYDIQTEACVDAMQAANTKDISVMSYVDAVRQKCWDKHYQTDKEERQNLKDLDCPSNCNGNTQGSCEKGVCKCSEGYSGPSCAQEAGAAPEVHMPETVMCDTRTEDCSWLQIFGQNFKEDTPITLHVHALKVDAQGHSKTGATDIITANILSPTQASAQLPSQGHFSVDVQVQNSATQTKRMRRATSASDSSFVFLSVDAQCYSCDMEGQTCDRKEDKDHCLITDVCLAADALDPDDSCFKCDPQQQNNGWSVVNSDECKAHEKTLIQEEEARMRADTIRVITAAILSASVAIAALVLYILVGRRSKEVEELKARVSVDKGTHKPPLTGNGIAVVAQHCDAQVYEMTPNSPSTSGGVDNPIYTSQESVHEHPAAATQESVHEEDYAVAL